MLIVLFIIVVVIACVLEVDDGPGKLCSNCQGHGSIYIGYGLSEPCLHRNGRHF